MRVASPVRRADQRNPPVERLAGRSGPTLLLAAWTGTWSFLLSIFCNILIKFRKFRLHRDQIGANL